MRENQKTSALVIANERGAVLVLGMLMLLIGSILAISLLQVTETEMKMSHNYDDHNKALMAAEAWVFKPNDKNRRAAFQVAQDNSPQSVGSLTALAASMCEKNSARASSQT